MSSSVCEIYQNNMTTNVAVDSDIIKIIKSSHAQISRHIIDTPLKTYKSINNIFSGNEIYFKLECLQKTGSFKIRGIINALLNLQKHNKLPKKIITYSTGNHAIGVAWAAKNLFDISAELYLPKYVANSKKELAKQYGASIIETTTRAEAESIAKLKADQYSDTECLFLPPSDNEDIIIGTSTIAYEALLELNKRGIDTDAIFVPIGGGSLASGTVYTANALNPQIKVFGSEPEQANDAAISLKTGSIFGFDESPDTIADGARTLRISERVFNYIKKLDGIYEISEEDIVFWTKQFLDLTGVKCEPTSALAIAAAAKFLQETQYTNQKLLVIISGSNA